MKGSGSARMTDDFSQKSLVLIHCGRLTVNLVKKVRNTSGFFLVLFHWVNSGYQWCCTPTNVTFCNLADRIFDVRTKVYFLIWSSWSPIIVEFVFVFILYFLFFLPVAFYLFWSSWSPLNLYLYLFCIFFSVCRWPFTFPGLPGVPF